MESLKYTVIKSKSHYTKYCDILENLVEQDNHELENEIELLTLLIAHYDNDHSNFNKLNPIEIIQALLSENNLKSKDLAEILQLSKGTVSKILNYQKGLSKESIRILSYYFKINQESLNKPYPTIQTHKNVS